MRWFLVAVLVLVAACASDVVEADPCLETAESVAGCQAARGDTAWTASAACSGAPRKADGSERGGRGGCYPPLADTAWLCCDSSFSE